ncbi:hypothetical protein VP01_2404g5 [Puccinia sorghi]|uniref:Uncharacterized protein n=1 Tax=Puccinia sorghi TaxID=27349 RepID=A0A0L6V6L5_9BASI|nr:hypothetical protein VP01_2404g5 [Puccinia sorghi]
MSLIKRAPQSLSPNCTFQVANNHIFPGTILHSHVASMELKTLDLEILKGCLKVMVIGLRRIWMEGRRIFGLQKNVKQREERNTHEIDDQRERSRKGDLCDFFEWFPGLIQDEAKLLFTPRHLFPGFLSLGRLEWGLGDKNGGRTMVLQGLLWNKRNQNHACVLDCLYYCFELLGQFWKVRGLRCLLCLPFQESGVIVIYICLFSVTDISKEKMVKRSIYVNESLIRFIRTKAEEQRTTPPLPKVYSSMAHPNRPNLNQSSFILYDSANVGKGCDGFPNWGIISSLHTFVHPPYLHTLKRRSQGMGITLTIVKIKVERRSKADGLLSQRFGCLWKLKSCTKFFTSMVQTCVKSRTHQLVRFHPTSPVKLQVGDCVRFSKRWFKTLGGIMNHDSHRSMGSHLQGYAKTVW